MYIWGQCLTYGVVRGFLLHSARQVLVQVAAQQPQVGVPLHDCTASAKP